MQISDDVIIERVQRGEREQFLELYHRYHRRIEAYARRQLRSAEAARDIASETFLRAFQSIDTFRTGERISYLGYLFLLCRRLIINEQKRLLASPILSFTEEREGIIEGVPDVAALPLTLMLDAERRQAVRNALVELSDEDQEILYLAFERDLSRTDMMQILEKPSVGAVRAHLYRALGKLHTIVVRQGYFAPVLIGEDE